MEQPLRLLKRITKKIKINKTKTFELTLLYTQKSKKTTLLLKQELKKILHINITLQKYDLSSAMFYKKRSRYRADWLTDDLQVISRSTGRVTMLVMLEDVSCSKKHLFDWGVQSFSNASYKTSVISTYRTNCPRKYSDELLILAKRELFFMILLKKCKDLTCINGCTKSTKRFKEKKICKACYKSLKPYLKGDCQNI